jgi:ABC-type polysaccharide/polyol phosphate transport system ATPase subunit
MQFFIKREKIMQNYLVEVENASVRFNLMREKVESLKEYVVRAFKNQLYYEEFWALSNISFVMKRGEIMGVIGPNGAGKTTLMRLIAGVLQPTYGNVRVHGTVAPLIALGAGFDPELTGHENIFLNGSMLGYSNEFMRRNRDEILDFAELHEFADVPLKNYSSGMAARLGFAVATVVQPDLLIADEVLAVGDKKFREKCENRIKNMIEDGMSAIIVSHSSDDIQELCSKALLLNKGRMVRYG